MIAMLIDADNVSYRNIKDMTDELRVCHKSVTHPFFVCVSIYSS